MTQRLTIDNGRSDLNNVNLFPLLLHVCSRVRTVITAMRFGCNKGPFVRNFWVLLIAANVSLGMLGCNSKGTPVDFANMCDKPHDGNNVEVSGYFKNTGSAMCSKSGNEPMRCPIDFVGEPGGTNPVRAHIDKGTGKSEIEAADGKGLQIHDETGAIVENSQKVKIVARVKRLDAAGKDGCYVNVKKIEKAAP